MTKVRSYRIDVDECAREGDAVVIGTCGGMTSQHLGTAASFDAGCCAGNIPVIDSCGKLPDSTIPSAAMKKCVYDKCCINDDAFDYNNFYNTPEIPVVNDPVITFKQGGISRGTISLNQVGNADICLMAGGLDAGKGTCINDNKIDINYDCCSINVDDSNHLLVVDYDTIKSGAEAGATAVQPSSLCTVATSGKYCDLSGQPTIPTDNCQLANGCNYITNSVNDLVNYYLKCETYTKCEVDTLISNFGGFEVVSVLPTTNIKTNVIYLLGPIGTGPDKYEEWIYYSNIWTKIGETTTDLSNYAKCCDIPTDNCQLLNSCGYTTCTGTLVDSDLTPYTKTCDLCDIATSGQYCDLMGTPNLCDVATSGKYCDLSGTPLLCTVATSGCYADLTGTPTIPPALNAGNGISISSNCINVNYDGSTIKKNDGNCLYADLTGYVQSCDLCNIATSGQYCDLIGTPNLCDVATSGQYCDLTGTPTIPTDNCQLSNGCGYTTCTGTLVASDLNGYAQTCDLATVATSGQYCDLIGAPIAPDVNVQSFTLSSTSDTVNATDALTYITNGGNAIITLNNITYTLTSKSSSSLVFKSYPSFTANTSDTTINVPTLTFTVSDGAVTAISLSNSSLGQYLQTDRNYSTAYTPLYNGSPATKKYVDDCLACKADSSSLCTVAISGQYCDLIGQPTIPTDNCQLANSCGYTTCTGTLAGGDLVTINGCCLVGSGDICIQGGVTSVNGCTGAVCVDEFSPASAGSCGQVLQKTTSGYDWATISLDAGDMCYSDFNWTSKSGNSITLDLNSTITPSADFTINVPSTIKEGQVYVLRVTNGSTTYTMTLGTGITNPWGVDLTLTPSGTDQFTFLATSSSALELQAMGERENVFVTQSQYDALPVTKCTDGKTYFIYEE